MKTVENKNRPGGGHLNKVNKNTLFLCAKIYTKEKEALVFFVGEVV